MRTQVRKKQKKSRDGLHECCASHRIKKSKKMRKEDYSQEDIILEFALTSHDDSSEDDVDEMERYAKAKLVISNGESVLQWWKKWSINYPMLSVLARSLLGIPASLCTSQRIFSATGRILEERRQNLGDDIVDDILFIRNFKKILL
ncbi:unnamed protein product [Rotaria magnacalcarata]|uniref:HAT C-terminal dimerisation domain-containing protein n=3 Tax=Rotaria magnacalcarata TaxID=392030 RepID=A0A816ZNZ3_9BILA|nr:unnamed protein product [Rotaria magnacalcarata]